MAREALQLKLFDRLDELPGREPGFSVRKSARARRLSIKVFPGGRVEVVVPNRTSARTVAAFVEEHRDWISKTQLAYAHEYPPDHFRLPDSVILPAVDHRVIVRYRPQSGLDRVRYRERNGILDLTGNTADETLCSAALRRWLASVARREFGPRLAALAAETGLPYGRMHIRMQRTCWGSRSSSGTLSLNLCLLFLDPALLRYLMIHELCHARHMNHSKRFWRLVGRFAPAYRTLDRRLGESWRDVPGWLGIY